MLRHLSVRLTFCLPPVVTRELFFVFMKSSAIFKGSVLFIRHVLDQYGTVQCMQYFMHARYHLMSVLCSTVLPSLLAIWPWIWWINREHKGWLASEGSYLLVFLGSLLLPRLHAHLYPALWTSLQLHTPIIQDFLSPGLATKGISWFSDVRQERCFCWDAFKGKHL